MFSLTKITSFLAKDKIIKLSNFVLDNQKAKDKTTDKAREEMMELAEQLVNNGEIDLHAYSGHYRDANDVPVISHYSRRGPKPEEGELPEHPPEDHSIHVS